MAWVSVPKKLVGSKQDRMRRELMALCDQLRAERWTSEEFLIGLASEAGSLAGAIQAVQRARVGQVLAELDAADPH